MGQSATKAKHMNQVYKITNQKNGKIYIGISTNSAKRRWTEHKSRFNLGERDHKLYQAMKKYGIENFDYEVIHETDNSKELSFLESQYIEKFDSFNNGYNMTCGDVVVSDETKQKLSKIFKGRKVTWGAKIVATRRKSGIWAHGVQVGSESVKSKKYLIKYPDGKEELIHGLRMFSREHNLSHNLLLAVLDGKQRHHKGYVLLARLNDHRGSEYTQVSGNGEYPVSLAG